MEQYFCNFRKYNEKGQRVALFAKKIGHNKLEIFKLTCSRQDNFWKGLARMVYEGYECKNDIYTSGKYHPEIFQIDIADDNKILRCFIEWCNETYYNLRQYIIAKGNILLSMKKVKINPKMDRLYKDGILTLELSKF